MSIKRHITTAVLAIVLGLALSAKAPAAVPCAAMQYDVAKIAKAVYAEIAKEQVVALAEHSPELGAERLANIKSLIDEAYAGGKDGVGAFVEKNYACKEGA